MSVRLARPGKDEQGDGEDDRTAHHEREARLGGCGAVALLDFLLVPVFWVGGSEALVGVVV